MGPRTEMNKNPREIECLIAVKIDKCRDKSVVWNIMRTRNEKETVESFRWEQMVVVVLKLDIFDARLKIGVRESYENEESIVTGYDLV